MKRCSKCKEIKSLDEFSRDISRKDGFCVLCKKCRKVGRAKNRDKNNAKKRARHGKCKDELNRKKRKYRSENKDKVINQEKAHRYKHRDEINKRQKKAIDELKDLYLKGCLVSNTGIKNQDITPYMIRFKRTVILYKRELRKIKEIGNELFTRELQNAR